MVNNNKMAEVYYNEFFEGYPKLSKADLKVWIEERRRKKKVFAEHPTVNNLTRRDIWQDRAKFYFLPFLVNCYRFTRQHRLPHFAIPVSPTCMFYRDRLHLRNFMDTVHQAFFRALEMCLPKGERIMLLVEKRFHVENPVEGGTQQLYNMLWDVDLSALVDGSRISRPDEVILPPMGAQFLPDEPRPRMQAPTQDSETSWDWDALNPTMPAQGGIELCRRTLWFIDDLNFLCKRYELVDECACFPEIVDVSRVPDEKKDRWAKTAREFYFKIFSPKDIDEDEEGEDSTISSDSDLDPDELDSTELEMLDSTLDFEQEDEEMKNAVSLLANIPKVTGMTQGMLDLMTSLTRIIPLIIDKVEDPKLKEVLGRTLGLLGRGMEKVLKICAFLGIKVEKKPSPAVGWLVKNRFKKNKPDFLTWEIDEMNKRLDELEGIDENPPKPPFFKGQIPLGVKPNHMYPQRMPLRTPPKPQPPIVPYPVTQPDHHMPPMPPPKPPKPPKPDDGKAQENGEENVNTTDNDTTPKEDNQT